MAVACALPVLAYFGGADWTGTQDDQYGAFMPLFQVVGALGLAWFFCGALLYRRMGMTRLALCLLCLAVAFALPTLGHFIPRLSFLATPDVAATFSRFSILGTLSTVVPLIGLCILVFVRPEDLLRWAPTGKAWAAYRIGHVANAALQPVIARANAALERGQAAATIEILAPLLRTPSLISTGTNFASPPFVSINWWS